MKQASIALRLLSSVICLILIFTLCACNRSQGGETKLPVSSDASSTDSSADSSADSSDITDDESETHNTVSVHPISGEINAVGSIVSAEVAETEKSVQLYDADLSTSLKGYAEKEATARRNEILKTPNTEELYDIKGTKYYISGDGDDKNDGRTPETAFKTIDALELVDLNKGDAVLFERGYVYRFKRTISVKSGITYGSYGKGNKPAIYGSPFNAAKSVWTPSKKKNVWQTDFSFERACGVFFDYGTSFGSLKNAGIGALDKNGDFYHDYLGGTIYVYSDKGNPANVYESIEISPSMHIFRLDGVKDVVIDNFSIKYGSYGVVGGMWENVYVTNCEMGYIGGMVGTDVRRGNAIEFMSNDNSNVFCDHNWIYQTFDSAITWQGYSSSGSIYKNISFSDNLLEYNNADFEFWEDEGVIIDGFVMDNNIMRFTSLGWGTREGIRGIEGCYLGNLREMIILEPIEMTNSIIDCPGRQIVNLKANVEQKNQFVTANNKYFVKGSYRTLDVVLKYFPDEVAAAGDIKAYNLEGLKQAFSRFDPTAELKWYK
ncbi:MAG: hypothetical protein IKK55_00795 [Clostridia bacterium]|nr:hypothetical protein [Clostridia bacterium]